MKIGIQRINNDIFTIKDYSDIQDNAEIAHIICELESIKLDLLHIWEIKNKQNET